MSEPTVAHPHPHGGGGAGLNEKIGPLPVKVWLVAVAGVVIVSLYLRKRAGVKAAPGHGGAAVAPTALDNTQPGAGNLAGSTPSYVDGTGQQLGGGLTNSQWLTKAENAMIGQGVDAYTLDQTLQAYLSGQQLTAAQQALFDKVVAAVGPVPLSVPAVPGSGGATGGYPGSGGGGGTGVAPPSSAPPWNPAQTPWATMVKGVFTDVAGGRPAFYGPAGQPGTAAPTGRYTTPYTMPDGRTAYYDPTSWTYANGAVNTAGLVYAQQSATAPATA